MTKLCYWEDKPWFSGCSRFWPPYSFLQSHPSPGHLALGREEGTVAQEVPSSLLYQRRAGRLPLVSLPTPRKNNEHDNLVPDGHPGSRQVCFGLPTCFFFLPGIPFVRRTGGVFFACGVKSEVLTRREFHFLTRFTERPVILMWLGGRVDTILAMGLGMRSSKYPGWKELPWQIRLFEQHQSPDYGRKHRINSVHLVGYQAQAS